MENIKDESTETKGKYVTYVLFGGAIGAVLGLVTYMKDWL